MARTELPATTTVGDLFTRPRTKAARARAKGRRRPLPRRERLLESFGIGGLLDDALALYDEGLTEFTDEIDAELDVLARQVERIEQLLRAARRT